MNRYAFPKENVRLVKAGGVRFGGKAPLALMAGPCVIESRSMAMDLAAQLVELAQREKIPFVFKASYDKANRSRADAFRGPGLAKGLAILAEIKAAFDVPILTDVHQVSDIKPAAEVADILQLPAFLSRQTDLVIALGESGKVVNLKKGQFLSPWDMRHVVAKVESTGNKQILLTERGASFGYGNLVADMRSLLIMRQFGYPVIFDATHSVQLPGGSRTGTGGDGQWAPYLSRAAVATGIDGLFWETHRNPLKAKSDKDNALPLSAIRPLWRQCRTISKII
ncbi:MAG: 3-deoxy-8-phosphooctulonate synthase [Verrucomicrobiota bacterium]|jgi:2-dehydro-3-deoxyphosphooctonate aldolase (KDO 8-P synthase)|nr:3-deoxy-8-phosphooctulonate synthase [Verrucomicrobiota bacterium]